MIRHAITVIGRETVYWERNPEAEATMVMLHGFRGNHMGLTDIAQHFSDYRLILPDLPGYGESAPLAQAHTIEDYALWLDAFIAELGLTQWASWSHSYSGAIALIQAAMGNHKPTAVISVSPPVLRRDAALWLTTAYYQMGRPMPRNMQKKWLASTNIDKISSRLMIYDVSESRRHTLAERGARNLATLDPKVVTEGFMSVLKLKLETYAPKVTMPVLVIAGAHDPVVPLVKLKRTVRLMPDSQLDIVADQGHLAPIERPAATATLTKRFLARVMAG